MYISFHHNICNCHDTYNEVKKHIAHIEKVVGSRPNYIGIRVDYENTVFWDYEGNNIPVESITKFHPELNDKIEAFINAFNEVPNIDWFNKINMASYMALKCRYEMYGYAMVDMLGMIYPNYIIVLEPL